MESAECCSTIGDGGNPFSHLLICGTRTPPRFIPSGREPRVFCHRLCRCPNTSCSLQHTPPQRRRSFQSRDSMGKSRLSNRRYGTSPAQRGAPWSSWDRCMPSAGGLPRGLKTPDFRKRATRTALFLARWCIAGSSEASAKDGPVADHPDRSPIFGDDQPADVVGRHYSQAFCDRSV